MRPKKRGYAFTLDGFVAAGIIITGILLVSSLLSHRDKTEQLDYLSKDLLQSLSEIKISEIQTTIPYVQQKIADGTITNLNNSVLVQIGEFWATNNKVMATELASIVINNMIPEGYGVNLSMGQDTIYERSKTQKKDLMSSRRMISGIEEGKPLIGSTSSGYLRRVRDKPSSAYIYYGGFVGQGNITRFIILENITVTSIRMELDVGGPFYLKINGIQCNSSAGPALFTPVTGNMTTDIWNISHCKPYIKPGQNNFIISFDNINNAYIAGGYIKIDYHINQFQESTFGTTARTYLPGIDGIVNLFDSFYVPGELHNLTVFMHYKVNTTRFNNTFYLTIGNETVFYDSTTQNETTITLSDTNFTQLNYLLLNASTVPIRIGFENISLQRIISGGEGFGDIALTTDVSGSMGWEFGSGNGGDNRSCDDPLLYDDSTSRISIARCVDKIFVNNILENITLNRIGLVAYTTNIFRIHNLTNNENELINEIEGYTDIDFTCISCGIAGSWNLLSNPPPAQLHKETWKFSLDYQDSLPPINWNSLGFIDSSWPEGDSSFGFNNTVTTTISGKMFDANLWEYIGDDPGSPADFSSGVLNYSDGNITNNFSCRTCNDGWDASNGTYQSLGTRVSIDQIQNNNGNNQLRIFLNGSSSTTNTSAAYGIEINITQELFDRILTGGYAVLSFNYQWIGNQMSNPFEPADEIWIKARITNTTGGVFYLGGNLDNGHQGRDTTNDIFATEDPDTDFSGYYSSQNITRYITEPGMYYLDFGGKLLRSALDEMGYVYFDNIRLAFSNQTGNTYYRTKFYMTDLSRFSDLKLYVRSDDGAAVYLNENLINNDIGPHNAAVPPAWNINGISIDNDTLVEGENILAVEVFNDDTVSGYFDLELKANMSGRQKAIVLMSDGEANTCIRNWTSNDQTANGQYCNSCPGGRPCCPNSTTGIFNAPCRDIPAIGAASDQVVNLSCYLHNNYNISIYTVAFGPEIAGRQTLSIAAACDNSSHYYLADNVSGLADIYQDIADSILTGFSTRESQVIVVSGGGYEESTLYPDSYIEYNYSPIVNNPDVNEIELVIESPKFSVCNPQIDIPTGLRIIDSKLVSYSGEHWTDFLSVNGIEVYNLSRFDNTSYVRLGDPFIVQVPPNLLVPGLNNFVIQTGDSPYISTNCSYNNSFIYTALVNSSSSRSAVLPSKESCNWTIESEDFINKSFYIPKNAYTSRSCNYTNVSHINSYDPSNAYDVSVYEILRQLDFDNDGRIIVNLEQEDLEVIVLLVSGLPYQWGPSVIEAKIWQ